MIFAKSWMPIGYFMVIRVLGEYLHKVKKYPTIRKKDF